MFSIPRDTFFRTGKIYSCFFYPKIIKLVSGYTFRWITKKYALFFRIEKCVSCGKNNGFCADRLCLDCFSLKKGYDKNELRPKWNKTIKVLNRWKREKIDYKIMCGQIKFLKKTKLSKKTKILLRSLLKHCQMPFLPYDFEVRRRKNK